MVDECSETWWTHLNIFGWFPEVNLANPMDHEEDVPETIGVGRPYSHRQSFEGSADFHVPALPRESALVLDPAYLVLRPILHRRQLFRKWPVTNMVATGWSGHSQGLMGPLQVVNLSPKVESLLAMLHVSEGGSSQHFSLQGPMEALVFALSLGMVRPAMADADAQPEKPDCHGRMAMVCVAAPGGAIVHHHAFWQTEVTEDFGEPLLHRLGSFVATRFQPQRKTRVVVQHSERMAAAFPQRKVPLKVHLPQFVGRLTLEALPGPVFGALGRQSGRDASGWR